MSSSSLKLFGTTGLACGFRDTNKNGCSMAAVFLYKLENYVNCNMYFILCFKYYVIFYWSGARFSALLLHGSVHPGSQDGRWQSMPQPSARQAFR